MTGTRRHDVAVDAFLIAALIFLVGTVLQMLTVRGFGGLESAPTWTDGLGMLALMGALFAAPYLAWQLHGLHPRFRDALPTLIGMVIALVVAVTAFLALFFLMMNVPPIVDRDVYGPIEAAIVLAVLTLVFLVPPTVRAVKDLVGPREHVRIDVVRLVLLVGLVGVLVWSMLAGGESAEIGLWLAPIGGGAALASIGAEIAQDRWFRARRPA